MENNMKNILIISLSATVLLISGCAQKPYVSTSPVMTYDLTGVDISTLTESKVCTSSESKDVSVRKAAQKAGFSTVYGVDTEVTWTTQLFGPDLMTQQCTIIYGK